MARADHAFVPRPEAVDKHSRSPARDRSEAVVDRQSPEAATDGFSGHPSSGCRAFSAGRRTSFARSAAPALRGERWTAPRASICHGRWRSGPSSAQATFVRAVDVALELFALTASVVRAERERSAHPHGVQLADVFAQAARRRIDDKLRDMWSNDDAEQYALSSALLHGDFIDLEQGGMGVPYGVQELEPETMEQFFGERTPGAERARPHERSDGHEGPQSPARAH